MRVLRLRWLPAACLLLFSAPPAGAQGAISSIDVFTAFVLGPGVVIEQHEALITEKEFGTAVAGVRPVHLTGGDPPTVEYDMFAQATRGGRGYGRVRTFVRFLNYSLSPSFATMDFMADYFVRAVGGFRTISYAQAELSLRSGKANGGVRVVRSVWRTGPAQEASGTAFASKTLFLPAAGIDRDGTIRPSRVGTQFYSRAYVVSVSSVPEPMSFVLLATGLAGLGALRWRRRRSSRAG